jgi:hypothetical protein
MLNSAADTERKKDFRFDVLSGLTHQRAMVSPSGVDYRSSGADITA